MASGKQNKLTGQIGEHLVAAKLGTMGYYAAPYSGNVPGFDLMAVDSRTLESFPVQVKTSNGSTLVHSTIDKWAEHRIDEEGYQYIGRLKKLPNPNIIWVLVKLKNGDITSARYFVLTEAQIQGKIVTRYKTFMQRHNNRRPSGSRSTQSVLNIKNVLEFEDNWKIISPRKHPKPL